LAGDIVACASLEDGRAGIPARHLKRLRNAEGHATIRKRHGRTWRMTGFLFQAHITSAGRRAGTGPRPYRLFCPGRSLRRPPSPPWIANGIQREMGGAHPAQRKINRAPPGQECCRSLQRPRHYCVARRLSKTVWEHGPGCGSCQTGPGRGSGAGLFAGRETREQNFCGAHRLFNAPNGNRPRHSGLFEPPLFWLGHWKR